MTTEDDKKLRQLLRMSQELPEPDWNLLARVSKKWSKFRPEFHKIESQQKMSEKKASKKKDGKTDQTGKE